MAAMIAVLKPNRHFNFKWLGAFWAGWRSCANNHAFSGLGVVQDPEDAWEINA